MHRIASVLSALLLAACAAAPSLPPLVDLSGRNCAAAVDLKHAVPVPFDAYQPSQANLGEASLCLAGDDGARTYAVFRLPQVAEEYLVGVTSKPAGLTLFSPRLMLLDAQGILLREVPRDSFLFHGANLHAALRARAGDAYLVVASDPRTIGQRSSQLAGTVQSTYAPVGVGGFMVYTGAESNTVRIFAHNGMIEVTAKPWPKIPDPGSTPTNTGDRPPRGRM